MEEHLRHCLERLRGEVDERTFTAFERYVIDEQPADEVAGALGLSVNNLYTIKWRLTHKISEQMRELTGELE
jgi:DNA-directed RNA polymerase specialized sigma24 family protein